MKHGKNIQKKIAICKKGFTLLLAVEITGIVLAISFGFSAFVLRELSISTLGRESQKAIFAADSGIECVFYWDFIQHAFATATPPHEIVCGGSDPSHTYMINQGCPSSQLPCGVSTFTLNFDNGACTLVEVDKFSLYPETKIDSRGRSTCVSGSPNRVERALRVIY